MNRKQEGNRFLVGARYFQFYGNGFVTDTVVEAVDNLHVRLAGFGKINKGRLRNYWEWSDDWLFW